MAQAARKASVICGDLGSASKLPMGWYSSLPGPSSTRRKTCGLSWGRRWGGAPWSSRWRGEAALCGAPLQAERVGPQAALGSVIHCGAPARRPGSKARSWTWSWRRQHKHVHALVPLWAARGQDWALHLTSQGPPYACRSAPMMGCIMTPLSAAGAHGVRALCIAGSSSLTCRALPGQHARAGSKLQNQNQGLAAYSCVQQRLCMARSPGAPPAALPPAHTAGGSGRRSQRST